MVSLGCPANAEWPVSPSIARMSPAKAGAAVSMPLLYANQALCNSIYSGREAVWTSLVGVEPDGVLDRIQTLHRGITVR